MMMLLLFYYYLLLKLLLFILMSYLYLCYLPILLILIPLVNMKPPWYISVCIYYMLKKIWCFFLRVGQKHGPVIIYMRLKVFSIKRSLTSANFCGRFCKKKKDILNFILAHKGSILCQKYL